MLRLTHVSLLEIVDEQCEIADREAPRLHGLADQDQG